MMSGDSTRTEERFTARSAAATRRRVKTHALRPGDTGREGNSAFKIRATASVRKSRQDDINRKIH